MHFREAFLTACIEFTTPEALFQILSRRLFEERDELNIELRAEDQKAYVNPFSNISP